MIEILRKFRMSKFRMSKEQLKSLKIRTTQMCGCVPELLWMRALNPRKNTQFSPHAGVRHIFHGGGGKLLLEAEDAGAVEVALTAGAA